MWVFPSDSVLNFSYLPDVDCCGLNYHRKFRWHFTGTLHLSQSAGIGGGPIINICLMMGLGYSSKSAMSMTYIFLMGGSFASVLQNITKRRGNGSPLMNLNLITLSAPMITSGSLFGVRIHGYEGSARALLVGIHCDSRIYNSLRLSYSTVLQKIYGSKTSAISLCTRLSFSSLNVAIFASEQFGLLSCTITTFLTQQLNIPVGQAEDFCVCSRLHSRDPSAARRKQLCLLDRTGILRCRVLDAQPNSPRFELSDCQIGRD